MPYKEFLWFERCGHNVLTEEPDEVADVLVNRVLADAKLMTVLTRLLLLVA